jgi:hypothetical protein
MLLAGSDVAAHRTFPNPAANVSAGAKARPDLEAIAARLKSCPDTKQRFSQQAKAHTLQTHDR